MKINDSLGFYIPLGSALLIFASAVKNVLVHAAFGIAIVRYINLSELFLLIIVDVVQISIIFILIGLFVTALERDSLEEPNENLSKGSEAFNLITTMLWFLIFLSVLVFLLFFGKDISAAVIAGTLLGLFIISLMFFIYLIGNISKRVKNAFIFFFSLFSIMLLMGAQAFHEIHKYRTQAEGRVFTFFLEDEVITTDKNLIYIGKTLDYLFLYNIDKDMARIIKSEVMKEMRIYSTN